MLRIQREANGQVVLTISGQLNGDNLTMDVARTVRQAAANNNHT